MPLTTCPDCQAEISDAAPACPRCGRPMGARPVAPAPIFEPPKGTPFQSQPDMVRSFGTFFIGGGCLLVLLLMASAALAKGCG